MKKRLLIVSTCIALAFAPFARAEEAKPAAAAKSDEPETELGGHMEKLNGAYRKMKRQIADPAKNESSLTLLATVKTHAEAALKLKPDTTSAKPAAEQAEYVASYQKEMKKMIELVDKLEVALKAGKNDEAAKIVTDLDAQQKSSHKQFKKQKKQ
jgi:soluble cytochrome b562